MKITIDTNIFVSSLLTPKSNNGKIIKFWQNGKFDICLSEPLLTEIARVLNYPKIKKHLQLDDSEIKNYISFLRFYAHFVDIKNVKAVVPKDRKDDHVLATFLASNSDYLISGDDDLLSLKTKYKIISPREFVEKFLH